MGRIRENIDVKGQKFWTLFDTGARNTYVVPSVAAAGDVTNAPDVPFRSRRQGS